MACAESELPVYALGGINAERVAACLHAGAYGVAVMTGMMGAEDSYAATAELLNVLN